VPSGGRLNGGQTRLPTLLGLINLCHKKRLKSAMITDDSLDNFCARAWAFRWVAAKLLPTLHVTHATLAGFFLTSMVGFSTHLLAPRLS